MPVHMPWAVRESPPPADTMCTARCGNTTFFSRGMRGDAPRPLLHQGKTAQGPRQLNSARAEGN
eukprot:9212527-Alexandrium_andersonii.AAC.1